MRVEVLVPASARDEVLRLAERLRASHRNDKDLQAKDLQAKDLQAMCDRALSAYGVRILDNVDLDRLPNLRARASVIAKAMIERGDARAFALGREILARAEPLDGDTRIRFFPLVKDEQWGLRLHQADLAINKILAASSRRKARDFADLVAIAANMCPLGPLIMAAAGKPPAYSPQKIIEQIRWHAQTIPDEEYAAIKGLPADWTPAFIRAEVTRQTDLAETYIMSAPVDVVGVLSVDADGTPIEVTNETIKTAVLRKATEEPEVMPVPVDFGATPWVL